MVTPFFLDCFPNIRSYPCEGSLSILLHSGEPNADKPNAVECRIVMKEIGNPVNPSILKISVKRDTLTKTSIALPKAKTRQGHPAANAPPETYQISGLRREMTGLWEV